jgi:cytochrome c biogenesis protein CcmG/thiol:disulfide interchange protein DsbE
VAACALLFAQAAAEEDEEGGAGFPDFKLENLDGDKVTDDEAFSDAEIVLIDFFTYSCKPCRKLWPHIDAMREEYGEYGFKAVMFDEDDPEGIPLMRSYLLQKDYSFEVLFDVEGDVQTFYSVEKHPTTILLDADGNILYKHEGYNKGDEAEIEEAIVDYLKEIGKIEAQ